MRRITAASFKAKCFAVLDEVQTKRETILITKRGKPVARLVPVNEGPDEIFNFFAGRGVIAGDVVSPALSSREWSGRQETKSRKADPSLRSG